MNEYVTDAPAESPGTVAVYAPSVTVIAVVVRLPPSTAYVRSTAETDCWGVNVISALPLSTFDADCV